MSDETTTPVESWRAGSRSDKGGTAGGLDYEEHVRPYLHLFGIRDYRGYVVWRKSPGEVIELLHLSASEPRRGYGRSLVADMVRSLGSEVSSVYGFTRPTLGPARAFYQAVGFDLIDVPHLYGTGAVLFSAPVARLKEVLGV